MAGSADASRVPQTGVRCRSRWSSTCHAGALGDVGLRDRLEPELGRRALLRVELFDGVARLASRLPNDEAAIAIDTLGQMEAWTLLRPEPFKEIS